MKKILTLITTAALVLSMAISTFAVVEIQNNTEGTSPSLDVSYIKTAPKMDGAISAGEYNLVKFSNYSDYFNWTKGKNLPSSLTDVENYLKNDMKVYMGWNGNDFYLAVQAKAPKSEYNCAFAENKMYMFRGWSLQVAVTDIDAEPESNDSAEVGIGYDPASGGEMISFSWGKRKNVKLTAGENFATNWDKDAEVVTYEMKLDLASILGKKAENEDLFRLGFCLNMGDGDISTDDGQKQIELGYSIAVSKAVKNLATIALVGKGSSDGDVDVDIPVDTEPVEEEQGGFDAADRFDFDGAAATFDITNGSVEAKDMTDDNGDKFVRLTVTGADPIIGSSNLTQGLNMDNAGEYLAIKYRTSSEKGNRFAINFLNSTTPELSRDYDCDLGKGLKNDGQWHTMVFDMTGYDDWTQFISKLYLCPFYEAGDTSGETIDIQWIKYYSEIPPVFEDEEYTDIDYTVSDSETNDGDVTTAPSEDETGSIVATDSTADSTASTAADSTSTDKNDDKGGLPIGGIIGIVAAAVVAVAAVVFFVIKKKKA